MEQIEIFRGFDVDTMKERINDWHNENPNIEVKARLQNQNLDKDGYLVTIITIFYTRARRKQKHPV